MIMKKPVYRTAAGLAACTMALATLSLSAQAPGGRDPGPPQGAPARQAAPPKTDPVVERARLRIRQLNTEGRTQEARQLAQRLRQAGHDTPARPEAPTPRMKIRNLRQAAALLEAAGYSDHAARINAEADRITADAQRARPAPDKAPREATRPRDGRAPREATRPRDGRAPREAVRPRDDSAANAAMAAEIRKLRSELEALRAEIRKMSPRPPQQRGAGAPRPDRE